MLQRLRTARLLWPTLASLAALAVLIGLGNWQMERKRWKEGLTAQIAERVHAPPVPLAQIAEMAKRENGKADVEYTHVVAKGRLLHDKERYLYAPAPSGLGWHVLTPLETDDGTLVWINRGHVPDLRKPPAMRIKGQVEGETEVRGLVRSPPAPSLFAAQNDPIHNIWYWVNLPALTASAFPEQLANTHPRAAAARTLPFIIEADAEPAPPGGLPTGGITRLTLSNRHLEYALTWYGLAATLAGVYLAFAASRLRAAT